MPKRTKPRCGLVASILTMTATLVIVGCAGNAPPQSLAKACQIRSCECAAVETSWLGRTATTDIRWQADGDASCPDGFVLRMTD